VKIDSTLTTEQVIIEYSALVHSIAISYQNKGIETDDLVQEGYIGLLEACKHFDVSQKVKFSTYAVYWIKKYILQALEKEYNSNYKAPRVEDRDLELVFNAVDKISGKADNDNSNFNLTPDMPLIEQKVIRLSYEQCLPLKDISIKLGISTERVRQIRQKALRRLKSDYLNGSL
jgi:RNA polymerase sigma factor (sigma-70 family)